MTKGLRRARAEAIATDDKTKYANGSNTNRFVIKGGTGQCQWSEFLPTTQNYRPLLQRLKLSMKSCFKMQDKVNQSSSIITQNSR